MSETNNPTRRAALQTGTALVAGCALVDSSFAEPPMNHSNVYESLGIKPVINAAGTFTALGGSVMPPEVAAAWSAASRHFVDILDLQDKVGTRIAKLIGVEAAMVTTGAAGAILLGTAAAVTGSDRKLIAKLPDTAGAKNEVIIQKSHRSCYDNQMTNVGVKLVTVEKESDVEKSLSPRTAMMFFMNHTESSGAIGLARWIELAKKDRIPTLLDAAADVPPVGRLTEYTRMGFDLVAFSGGKAIRGPNDTGLLLGRKDLIEAAKLNANPHCGTIGRMMKVGKEDVIALLAAVERFVSMDHDAEWKEFEARIAVIEAAVRGIPSIQGERIIPEKANRVPHLQITWDETKVRTTPAKLTKVLADCEPSIRIGRVSGTGEKGILVSVLTLQQGEERVVADQLAALLKKAAE